MKTLISTILPGDVMKDNYILSAELDFDVAYGVDTSVYLIGVYGTEEEALKIKEKLKLTDQLFTPEDIKIYGLDDWNRENPAKWSDLNYKVRHYKGDVLYLGGASYCE